MDDLVSRQEAKQRFEQIIIDSLYIGDKKLTDLIASGRLRTVGLCSECKHCYPPLKAVVDGEIKEVTPLRCSRGFDFVEENGWCYKFEQKPLKEEK